VLIVLRSMPELVWALVFVRVVGLGPTAGVLAIALTYGGMLGKVYAEILESGEPDATAGAAAQRQRPPAGLLLRPAAATTPPS
jgi:ABC-type phosphate/phosphonate transport system permease subunit